MIGQDVLETMRKGRKSSQVLDLVYVKVCHLVLCAYYGIRADHTRACLPRLTP